MVNAKRIADVLVQRGEALFKAERRPVDFAKDPAADALINDLDGHPHAFVLACVMDRQIKSEKAWRIPHLISRKLGGFSFPRLRALSLGDLLKLMTEPEPLHRFPDQMARNFHAALDHIANVYAGDAGRIWRDEPPSAEVVLRFLRFRGVGPKIATMAANLLATHFKVPLADYYSVDVSADVHVRRVFQRLGLVTGDADIDEVIYCARALHPAFPGILDFPVWEIGRTWCRPHAPRCTECYMNCVCPAA